MNMFQAYYEGKKIGNPRTEKEKIQVEPCFTGILWVVISPSNPSTEGVSQ